MKRLRGNQSQDVFAEKLGMTQQKYQRWESGSFLPRADAIVALASKLSVTPNDLLLTEQAANAPTEISREDLKTFEEFASERGLTAANLVAASVRVYADAIRKNKALPVSNSLASSFALVAESMVNTLEELVQNPDAPKPENETPPPTRKTQRRKTHGAPKSSERQESEHEQ